MKLYHPVMLYPQSTQPYGTVIIWRVGDSDSGISQTWASVLYFMLTPNPCKALPYNHSKEKDFQGFLCKNTKCGLIKLLSSWFLWTCHTVHAPLPTTRELQMNFGACQATLTGRASYCSGRIAAF